MDDYENEVEGKKMAIRQCQVMASSYREEHEKFDTLEQKLKIAEEAKLNQADRLKSLSQKGKDTEETTKNLKHIIEGLKTENKQIKSARDHFESKAIEKEEIILGINRELNTFRSMNESQRDTIANLINKQKQDMEIEDDNSNHSEEENENQEPAEAEEKTGTDDTNNIPSRRTPILTLKISASTPNVIKAPIGQQWISTDKEWCAVEWDRENSTASFEDLFEAFQDFGEESALNKVILPHLNEHKVRGYTPRHKGVNTYISTIAAKGARAAKFGENEHIQSEQADFADELVTRVGTGFKCKFNILQIIGVLSPENGDKHGPLLNGIKISDVFGTASLVVGIIPNGTKVTLSRKTNGRKWDKFPINARGHKNIAFVISDPEAEIHVIETPKAEILPLHIGFILLLGFIPELQLVHSLSHTQLIKNIQTSLFGGLEKSEPKENDKENDYTNGSLMQMYQMGQINHRQQNRNNQRGRPNKRCRRYNRYNISSTAPTLINNKYIKHKQTIDIEQDHNKDGRITHNRPRTKQNRQTNQITQSNLCKMERRKWSVVSILYISKRINSPYP